MPGNIGYLVAIVRRLPVGAVDNMLVAVTARQREVLPFTQTATDAPSGIHSFAFHLAHIDVGPYKHIVRHGHNLVSYMIQISVCCHLCFPTTAKILLPRYTYIILVGVFGIQIGAAVVKIIALVEGGHAEDVLIGEAHEKSFGR